MRSRGSAWQTLLAVIWLASANGAAAQSTSNEAAQYQRIAAQRPGRRPAVPGRQGIGQDQRFVAMSGLACRRPGRQNLV